MSEVTARQSLLCHHPIFINKGEKPSTRHSTQIFSDRLQQASEAEQQEHKVFWWWFSGFFLFGLFVYL